MKPLTFPVVLLVLAIVLAGCALPTTRSQGLAEEISKPNLAVFAGVTPPSVGDFTQDRALTRGEELFLSNGQAQLWIRLLGTNPEGRSKWQCTANHVDSTQPCQRYANGQQQFLWNGQVVAYSEGENGRVHISKGWIITYNQPEE